MYEAPRTMFFVPRPRTEAAERAFSYGGSRVDSGVIGTKPLELDCPFLGLRKSQLVFVYFLNAGTILYKQRNIIIEDITWPHGDTKFRCAHS